MRSTLSLLCLVGLLISFVLAAPAPLQKRAFKIERVRNNKFKGHNGPAQLMKAHRKYRIRPPQDLVDALTSKSDALSNKKKGHKHSTTTSAAAAATSAASSTTNTTATTNTDATNTTSNGVGLATNTPTTFDTEYVTPVTIGGQTLMLDFDTGSSDLWIFNTQLSTKETSGQTLYDSSKSANFAEISGATFAVSYGDGSEVAGNVGTDTVEIGGATVTKQAIELATAVSSSFIEDSSSDGLLGLAYSTLNQVTPTQQKTFFDNVQGDLALPIIAADLRHNETGTYEFGATDSSRFVGSLNTVAVNTTNGFWQFSSTSFAVGDGATQSSTSPGQAIADTGTTLLLTSTDVVNGYFADITGAEYNSQVGGVTVPCDATMPDLQIDVGGTMATVNGTYLIYEEISDNVCYSGLQAIDSDLMIFGDVFFKSNYVVFNLGDNTLSFATHA